ncbi:Aberrant root formation protein [Thalictrum thalictroides]|uniref:Aberrant root formation protein n=1 Tax=Thalictrum thalictroides TaxID=46969 RepID=A0A7J6X4Z6_THATH|nr:Aberrant root formation protein [Thalictrum thalictroides]
MYHFLLTQQDNLNGLMGNLEKISINISSATLQLKLEEETTTIYISMSNHSVIRLKELLNICSTCIILGESEDAVSSLVEFVNQIYEEVIDEEKEEEEALKQNALEILNELLGFISSPSLDQMVLDAFSFVLPKLVVKFAPFSNKFCEIAEAVIGRLISTCSPRDMLAYICEVLDCPNEMFNEPAYFTPLLGGLSKVFVSLQRRHFEHMKEALPAVLNVLQAVSVELSDENLDSFKVLIDRAILIAYSIREVCQKLEGERKEQSRALLGLFVLQLMALASITLPDRDLNMLIMSQLSLFLRFCNLSYLGLVTGGDVEASTIILKGVEESDNFMSCFSLVKEGAFIAVVWGIISDEVVKAADEDLTVVKENLRNSQAKRWQTVGMLKYLLASIDQPWKLKEHAVDFLLSIMERNTSQECSNGNADCSSYVPSLYTAVQSFEMVIIYAPDAILRKKFFAALKLVSSKAFS